jgi:hypothetical protein
VDASARVAAASRPPPGWGAARTQTNPATSNAAAAVDAAAETAVVHRLEELNETATRSAAVGQLVPFLRQRATEAT